MRPALLALLALPALAPAQTTPTTEGTISTSSSTINLAQCNGTDPATVEPKLGLSNSIGLRWFVKLDGTAAFDSTGKFDLYSANQQPFTNTTSGLVTCNLTPTTPSGTFTSRSLETGIDAPLQSTASTRSYLMTDVVTKAGFDCAQDATTIYLCVNWLQGGTPRGWATATVTVDLTPPANPPSGVELSPGDGVLRVTTCSAGSDVTSFKAKATSTEESQPHYSSEASHCGDLVINGLVNSRTYTVVVYGMDDAKNPSDPSTGVEGTPIPTDDFWTHYRNAGGREEGGCSTSGAAVGLLGLLSLALLRRRRP